MAELLAVDLVVPSRFRGPANSGNGGWTAGALAELVHTAEAVSAHEPVEVTLRRPPPLELPMPVSHTPGVLAAHDGEHLVAQAAARPEVVLAELPFVELAAAQAAQSAYAGHQRHPFASCFACGTDREPGDGLRIFPGRVPGTEVVAASWTPDGSTATHGSVSLPIVWAALDCIGGWTHDIGGRPMVLGRMTACVFTPPTIGAAHVVVGRLDGTEGRKSFTSSALFAADGTRLALAQHEWITVDPETFQENA